MRIKDVLKSRLRNLRERLLPTPRPIAYLDDHFALTKTVFGQKMLVDTRDLSVTPHLLLDGYWEEWITTCVRRRLRPGMQVLDIGANLGYYSLLAAAAIGPSGRLYSFEANPSIADLVFRNLQLNGFADRATVIPKAVFSRAATLDFHIHRYYQASSSLWEQRDSLNKTHDSTQTIQVESVKLDDYFPSGTRVDFIKLDAEGAEEHIFTGADRLLRENHAIEVVVEFAPALLRQAGSSPEQLYHTMHALGFSAFRIGHDSSLQELSPSMPPLDGHCDLLLYRKSSR